LWAVIESYIDNPGPVGSRYVTKKYDFGYSPATIRNIMADLEDMGYLVQPYTSAGRVPTDKGYRFYVEQLLDEEIRYHNDFARVMMDRLRDFLQDMEDILDITTRILSTLSHYIAMAVSPGPEGTTLRRIEMFLYKDEKIAVFILTDEGIIKHRIIKNEFCLSSSDLNRITNFLNKRFSGFTIKDIREALIHEIAKEKEEFDNLINKGLKLCIEAIKNYGSNIFITGLTEMLELPEFKDIERIKELSRTIEDKHAIIKLIDTLICSEGVQVIIGTENPVKEMHTMSVITSTYKEKDRPAGLVGIIGPKRMDYITVISLVDTAARVLTKIFEEGGGIWRKKT